MKEIWDFLSSTTVIPDYNGILDIKRAVDITEDGVKNQIVHIGDDNSEEVISLSDESVFYVNIGWDGLTESESGTIYDYYHDTDKGNGMANSFEWTHYNENPDPHNYVVRFASSVPRVINKGMSAIHSMTGVKLKILGRPADFGERVFGLMDDPRLLNVACEAPGPDIVVNGDFTSVITGWNSTAGAILAIVAGGQSGNCLQITCDGSNNPLAFSNGISVTAGDVHTLSWYVKQGTESTFNVHVFDVQNVAFLVTYGETEATAAWVRHSAIFTVAEGCTSVQIFLKQIASAGAGTTILFDTVKMLPAYLDISGNDNDGKYLGTWATADRIAQEKAWLLSPNGTDAYIDCGDSDDLSYGDGSNDSAVTWFGMIEIVNSGIQTIISKRDDTTGSELREWSLIIQADETIKIIKHDESANVICTRTSDAALSVGLHSFVITDDGTGGITAANGITIYIDGALVASTAVNNANYVAMENLATPAYIGAYTAASGNPDAFFDGDFGCLGIDASEWTAADALAFHNICLAYYSEDGETL